MHRERKRANHHPCSHRRRGLDAQAVFDDPRHPQFSLDELRVCVAEAAAHELGVMAHAQGTPGIKNALHAGVRSIEHGVYLDDECLDLMLASGTWLVPTLLAPIALVQAIEAGTQLPDAIVEKARNVVHVHRDAVARAIGAGVKIAMGTDSGVFEHGRNTEELELLVEAGMTPADALVAATSSAAALLGLDDCIGRIVPGRRADLTIVSGDPYDFAGYRDRIAYVMRAGRIVRSNRDTRSVAGDDTLATPTIASRRVGSILSHK